MSARIPHLNPEPGTRLRLLDHCGFSGLLRFIAFLALASLALSTADAQITTPPTGSRSQQQQHIPPMDFPPVGPNANFEARRIRQLDVERQKALVSDTNDLLKLTKQLNAEVAKDGSSSLTLEQLRMLAKIEKLAKSVREKMSNPVQRSVFEDNFPPSMNPPVPVR